ncbi:MAG: tetratricopeptide repeat protein, partial [Planctomycetota bacterium]
PQLSPQPQQALPYPQQAQNHAKKQNFQQALQYLQQAAKLDPNNEKILLPLIQYASQHHRPSLLIPHAKRYLQQHPKNANVRLILAKALAQTGQSQQALQHYQLLLQHQPTHLQAAFLAGETARESAQFQLAKKYYNLVIEIYQALDNANASTYALTGAACLRLKRYEDAQNMFRWALEEQPYHPLALYYYALYYLTKQKPTSAQKMLKKLLQHQPTHPLAHIALAQAYLQQNQLPLAQKHLQLSLKYSPQNYLAYHHLALLYAKQKKWNKCITYWQKAIQLHPNFYPSYLYLLACYTTLQQKASLRQYKIRLLRLYPNPTAISQQVQNILNQWQQAELAHAHSLLQKGLYLQAKQEYTKILQQHPQHPFAQLGLLQLLYIQGNYSLLLQKSQSLLSQLPHSIPLLLLILKSHLQLGKYTQALQQAQKLVQIQKNNPLGHYFMGKVYQQMGNRTMAVKKFTDALSTPTSTNAQHLLAKAQAAAALGNPHQANEYFYQAEDANPTSPEIYYHHARLFLEKYDANYAQKLLNKALKLNPHYPPLWLGFALCQLEERNFSLVQKYLQKTLHLNPSLCEARYWLGFLYLQNQQYLPAQQQANQALRLNPKYLPAHALLAAIFYLQGKQTQFQQKLQSVHKLHPNPSEFYTHLSDIVEDHFLYKEAAQFAQKALSLAPYSSRAATLLGINLLRLGLSKKAKKILEKAYQTDKFNLRLVNTLRLLDEYDKKYLLYPLSPQFHVRIDKNEAPILLPYLTKTLQQAWKKLTQKYKILPPTPLVVEVFSNHQDFSVRTIGLPFIGAMGVCFGKVVAIHSPKAFPAGKYNWRRTLWHEFVHVLTLTKTQHRIPRWLTEGISVYEETQENPSWQRDFEKRFLEVYHKKQLRNITQLNLAFQRPRYRDELLVAYYQAGLVVEFIVQKWGFAKILSMLQQYAQALSTSQVIPNALRLSCQEFDKQFLLFVQKRFSYLQLPPKYDRNQLEQWLAQLEDKPNSPELLGKIALAYLDLGATVDAEIFASKALALSKKDANAWFVLGMLAWQKNPKKSVQYLQTALKYNPQRKFQIHWLLGQYFVQKKKIKQAKKHLHQAQKLYPNYLKLLYLLLHLSQQQKNINQTLYYQKQIAKIDEYNWQIRQKLMVHYLKQANFSQAINVGEEILDISPYFLWIHRLLVKCYKQQKRYQATLREYSVWQHLLPQKSPRIYYEMAKLYLQLQNIPKAKEYCRKTLQLQPTFQKALKLLKILEKKP